MEYESSTKVSEIQNEFMRSFVYPKMQTYNYKEFCPTKQIRIVAQKTYLHSPKNHQKSATSLVCVVGQESL